MTDLSDTELIHLVQSKDERAFIELYQRYNKLIAHIAKRFGYVQSEDIVQEVFLRVWMHSDRYDLSRGSSFQAWITRIAANYLLNVVKRDKRLMIGLDDLPEPPDYRLPSDRESDQQESVQKIRLINKGWGSLSLRHRQLLILRYFEGQKPAEIAQICGGTANSIRTEIHRAKKKLGLAICAKATLEEIKRCL